MKLPGLILVLLQGSLLFRDIEFTLFAQTMTFVLFNGVQTLQYVIWWIVVHNVHIDYRLYKGKRSHLIGSYSLIAMLVLCWSFWEVYSCNHTSNGWPGALEKMQLFNMVMFAGYTFWFYNTIELNSEANLKRLRFKIVPS